MINTEHSYKCPNCGAVVTEKSAVDGSNPKQILINFCDCVRDDVMSAYTYIKDGDYDEASDFVNKALGECDLMLSILRNGG